ncbi:hypothetical protein BKA70DRAFT_42271 [Coprinopsis sp. MPI-PUGE-AT-0042]|nr:hypothetical protein BKA70DRAFT_42271 [Coprinopsis sp. MPI-PUGE-AT-0042]
MPASRYTARLTNLSSSTTIESLTSSPLFTSNGLSVSPGQTHISLATGLEGTKIATVTFRHEAMLHRALSLGPQERMVDGKCIALDAGFEGFTPLSDGEDIDVVAIHGLNGHAFDAWFWRGLEPANSTDDVDCFMWLRDALPERFPGARILLYGYNANTVSDVSTGRLRTFGETFLERLLLEREHDAHRHKPLILVAHSMGGLVLKQALTLGDTRADQRYHPLIQSVRAVTFFGTPHQGANGVTTGKLIANLLTAVNLEARGDLLKELERNSTSLFDLTSDFRQVVQRLGVVVYTMYEAKKTVLGRWPFKKALLVRRIE